MGPTPCEPIRQKAESKLEDVEQKIENLKRMKDVLSELITECKANGITDDCVILNALEGRQDDKR